MLFMTEEEGKTGGMARKILQVIREAGQDPPIELVNLAKADVDRDPSSSLRGGGYGGGWSSDRGRMGRSHGGNWRERGERAW